MILKSVEAALKNRLWVAAVLVLTLFFGASAVRHIPIDAVPDITNVQVLINTKTQALDPEKIEKLVTYPIEIEMSGLQGLEEIRSLSKYGLSQVILVFSDDTSVYFARQLVSERMQNLRDRLPEGITPELGPITSGLSEVLMYVIEPKAESDLSRKSEKERLLYLREVQDYQIRPQLKTLPGVADIDSNGGFDKQIHINFFPQKLRQYGLSMESFIQKIETLGENFGGGYIQKDGNQIIVRASGKIESLEDLKTLPLSINMGGQAIHIQDVAEVSVDHSLRVGAATHGGQETVFGTVLMRTGANSREVARDAEQMIQDTLKIPEDVQIKVLYSRQYLVNATIKTVAKSLSEGAVLVIVVLLLMLGHLRAAVVVSLAIPFSMLFAFKGMKELGISANLMSLGAIDFGLLVDASVVLIENIIRRFEQTTGEISKRDKIRLILEATAEISKPMVFGLSIIILVYVPILYLEGIEGKMFKPMAMTIVLALFGSLLIALFVMPTLAYFFISPHAGEKKETWLFRHLKNIYQKILDVSLNKRWFVPAAFLTPALLGLLCYALLGSDFIPQLDEKDMVINFFRPTQMGIDESVRWQKRAEDIIKGHAEVESVFSRIGTPESALDPMGPNLADTFVILKKDRSLWPKIDGSPRSKEELFHVLKKELEEDYPEQSVSANQPIELRFNEILEGSRADISLRFYGPDLDRLLDYAEKSKEALKDVPGLLSIEFDPLTALTRSPVLDVNLNYQKMARYGLALKDVNNVLEASMSGHEVGSFYNEDRRFPIMLHLDESLRNNINEIASIPVGLPMGGTIPLSEVVDIQETQQVTTVARSHSQRYSALSMFIENRDLKSLVAEAQNVIAQKVPLEPGYEAVWGGQFKNMQSASQRLMVIIPMTLLIIFILLLQNFQSFRHSLLVFSAIPFASVGGFIALYLRGINMSVSTSVGFIALSGIATLNTMVLVNYFHQLQAQGLPLKDVIYQGSLTRLRPVLMTALVAGLGFLPMALNTGTGAEVQRPLATVVIGGLFTSTLLTLLVIPYGYRWMEERFDKKYRQ